MELGAGRQQQQPQSPGFSPHPAAWRGSAGSRHSGGTLVPTSITCFSPTPSMGLAPHGAGWRSLELFGLCRGGRVCSQLPEAPAESCPCALARSQAAPLPAPCCAGGAAAAGWEHGGEQVAGFSSVPALGEAGQGAGTGREHNKVLGHVSSTAPSPTGSSSGQRGAGARLLQPGGGQGKSRTSSWGARGAA